MRNVPPGGEDSPFNRSFGKAYLLFDVHDLGIKGLYANLAAEGHYDYNDGKLLGDWILAVAGAAGYEGHGVKAEAGTYYQRFKYQYYLDVNETEDVRTVYASLAWKLVDWLTVKAKYELEWTDRYVHTVTATVLQSF